MKHEIYLRLMLMIEHYAEMLNMHVRMFVRDKHLIRCVRELIIFPPSYILTNALIWNNL